MDPIIDINCSNELIRIGTFIGWPGSDIHCKTVKPSPLALSRNGFYFTGSADEVICYVCGLRVKDWEGHHDPPVVHALRSPGCPLLVGVDHGNVPLITPDDREVATIRAMLQQVGHRLSTSQSGAYPSSSLITQTLTEMYGDSMMRPRLPPQASSSARGFNSPVRGRPSAGPDMVAPPSSPGARALPSPRPSHHPPSASVSPSGNKGRRSSASEGEQAKGKPPYQRTSSCATGLRPAPSNSETIANSPQPGPPSDLLEYQESQEARLATFRAWAGVRGASAQEFAQAGFIFIGAPDRVQCAFCNGILRNWNDNDRPIEEHRKHFPTCSFVTDFLSAITVAQPRHTDYCTLESREKSFLNWSSHTQTPSPEALARAGFFYVGHGDNVKCFFCDGGLRNWEPSDAPWREHARWFPKCDYVRQSKGHAFIQAVTRETQNLAEYQTASLDETAVKNVGGTPGPRSVDPREVTSRMDSEMVKAVLKMEVPKNLVKKAIRRRLQEDGGNGNDFTSATDLLEAVFNLDPNEPNDEERTEAGSEETGMGDEGGPPSDGSSTVESMRILEENRQLKEQKQCKICMDEEVCVAFLPCGHLVCCSTCAPALNSCPICRAKIRGTVRTYMA